MVILYRVCAIELRHPEGEPPAEGSCAGPAVHLDSRSEDDTQVSLGRAIHQRTRLRHRYGVFGHRRIPAATRARDLPRLTDVVNKKLSVISHEFEASGVNLSPPNGEEGVQLGCPSPTQRSGEADHGELIAATRQPLLLLLGWEAAARVVLLRLLYGLLLRLIGTPLAETAGLLTEDARVLLAERALAADLAGGG